MWEKPELFVLLIIANGTPILLEKALGARFNRPLDGGLILRDGRRLLGDSGTIRGVAGAVLATAGVASLLGHGARVGALIGLFSMAGDAASSFIKRRLGLKPGDKSTGLDQIPESLLPLVVVSDRYGLGWLDVTAMVSIFTVFDMVASRVLYRLNIRRRPH
jgi:CDP-2,3-bis-(O-geranylgeranyl)-sn-glycerol synthase